ncbi:hypothetical protein V8E36_003777, partial [Tilletia maclaganii]
PQQDGRRPPAQAPLRPRPSSEAGSAAAAAAAPQRLTHVDPQDSSRARMVDVSTKTPTFRTGVAVGRVFLPRIALDLVRTSEADGPGSGDGKGPVLRTAQLAGIMGAKRTAELIPLCHPLPLSHVDVVLDVVEYDGAEDRDTEQARRRRKEAEALAASDAFLRQATSSDGRDGGQEGREAGGSRAGQDFGFRIEDLVDADRWRGRDFDLDDAGAGVRSRVAFNGPTLAQLRFSSPSSSASGQHGISLNGPASQPVAADDPAGAAAGYVQVTCTARTTGSTGVEMEALVGANVACLTIWDMVKAVAGREM